ncbi:MAG: RICIN domain-containing protein [Bacteroidales bacterium]|nr:RICIN domain-containing protein [Bacteroidales bacterium]
MKKLKKALIAVFIGMIPVQIYAWPGMPTPVLHVDGKNLKDPCGNNVLLHGVAITVSPWFNGCMYGSSYCRWDNYDVTGCLNYNKAVMNSLTNTSAGWYLNYIRLHIDPYWTNNRGANVPENDISQFNVTNFQNCVNQVIIPLIEHAKSRGMYVILRPPGVCPQNIAINDAYYNYLVTVWTYLSQHSGLKNRDNVMFELANEPINIRASDGTYGQDAQKYYDALKNFFQPIVNLIRNNGANNVLWIPGLGYQSLYRGLAGNRVTGSNIGYAVHVYPGYWGLNLENATNFTNAWNTHIKPVADIAPIAITETDWAPAQYDTWGEGTTNGFGTNLKGRIDASGNVSWNLLSPDNLIHMGDPNGGTAYDNNWQACAAPCKSWFAQYAQSNLPASSCGTTGNITVRARGTAGSEQIQIKLNGTVVSTVTLTTTMTNYSVTGSGTLQVQFTNDGTGRDVQVDYAIIDGTTYQAENQAINTGVWQNSTCGGSYSEWLHCNGYIQFAASGGGTTGLVNNGVYTIEFQTDPTKVLDLKNGTDANGTVLRPWSKNGATAQEWVAVSANGYWRFISNASASNRCIDLANASTSNGTSIRLWDNYSNDAQAWQVTSAGNGYYKIVSKLNTSRGWDIPNCNMDGNNNLQLWDYYGTSCQLYKFNYLRTKSTRGDKSEISEISNILEIYPNPAADNFTVVLPGTEQEKFCLGIYSLEGKKVYELSNLNAGEHFINVGLKKGIYFIKADSNLSTLISRLSIQ